MRWSEEEDAILKKYANVKTAEEIGLILERTDISVYCRASKLKVSMTKSGSDHWKSALNPVQRMAVMIMYDNGLTPKKCHMVITGMPTISKSTISDICCGGRMT